MNDFKVTKQENDFSVEPTRDLTEIKQVIKRYYPKAQCGIYDTRNTVEDKMETIYQKDDIIVDICKEWEYFEVFGLTKEEMREVCDYYFNL